MVAVVTSAAQVAPAPTAHANKRLSGSPPPASGLTQGADAAAANASTTSAPAPAPAPTAHTSRNEKPPSNVSAGHMSSVEQDRLQLPDTSHFMEQDSDSDVCVAKMLSLSANSKLTPMNDQEIRDIIQRRSESDSTSSSQPFESLNLILGLIPSLTKSSQSSVKLPVSSILFIGDTGAGKSTTVNFLAGQKMKMVDKHDGQERYDVDSPAGQIARIGHDGSESETLFAKEIIPKDARSMKFVDCPGFGDSRGFEFDCAHAGECYQLLMFGPFSCIALTASF